MIVADFASEYGIRLHCDSVMWPEFVDCMRGLLAADTRVSRRFAPKAPDREYGGEESV